MLKIWGHTWYHLALDHILNCLIVCMTKVVMQSFETQRMLCCESMFSVSGMQDQGIEIFGGEKSFTSNDCIGGFVGDPTCLFVKMGDSLVISC